MWIAGQTARALQMKYTNARTDPRFRIDYDKLLPMVANNREIAKVYRYGNKLPVIERRKTIDRPSASAMEKMIVEIEKNDSVVLIILTGDESLLPAINHILTRGVPVEIWSWKHSMATNFKTLSTMADSNFTAYYFDDVELKRFGFIEYRYRSNSTIPIKSEHAIQCIVPSGKLPIKEIFKYFEQKNLLVYIRSFTIAGDEKHQLLVIEIQETDPKIILGMPRDFKYEFKEFVPWKYPVVFQEHLMRP